MGGALVVSLIIVKDVVNERLKAIADMASKSVLIGIPSDSEARTPEKTKKGTDVKYTPSNAEIGYTNEFGTPIRNIPPRPFLLPAVKMCEKEIDLDAKKAAPKIIDGQYNVEYFLDVIGTKIADRAKLNITESVNMKDLSEVTIQLREEKGFFGTKPLFVTGSLTRSITHLVVDE